MKTPAQPSKARVRTIAMAAAALGLSGCAVNPLASWTRPAPGGSPATLEYAQRYADAARAGYQEKRLTQVQSSATLNSGLLGLGIVGTGLAVAKVHRDALIGTGMLGGSAYAFGQQNLNPQYLKIYEAGIDAIGCAKQAVAPLAIPEQRLKDLNAGLNDLVGLSTKLAAARALAQGALLTALQAKAVSEAEAAEPKAAIAAAAATIEASNTLIRNGQQVLGRTAQAGDRLVNAVESIDAAVNRALTATLPDPASVFKIIPGLASFAGGIVPGTDAAIRDAVANSQAALQGKSVKAAAPAPGAPLAVVASADRSNTPRPPPPAPAAAAPDPSIVALNQSLTNLAQTTEQLLSHLAKVNGMLPTEDALAGLAALRDCGVTDVAFPLKAIPEKPNLVAGATRHTNFMIEGGTKPYVARLLTTPLDGVTVTSPVPFDSSVGVDITDKVVAQTFAIQITDSSNPARQLTVTFEVKPK